MLPENFFSKVIYYYFLKSYPQLTHTKDAEEDDEDGGKNDNDDGAPGWLSP